MAGVVGPRFVVPSYVTDGLVGHWDAGNPASYPGTGTDWFDLTANANNGVLTNGPTYSSVGGDHIEFDGSTQFVDLNLIDGTVNPLGLYGNLVNPTSIYQGTMEIWINPQSGGDIIQGVIEKSNGSLSADGWGSYIRNGELFYNVDGQQLRTALYGGDIYSYDIWTQLVARRNADRTVDFYKNGSFFVSSSPYTLSRAVPSDTCPGRIGKRDVSGGFFKGKIGVIRIYSRAITGAEIQTNYNQLKTRYGLS